MYSMTRPNFDLASLSLLCPKVISFIGAHPKKLMANPYIWGFLSTVPVTRGNKSPSWPFG